MLELFKWMSELSLFEGIKLFILIAILLASIPYFNIITAFYKHIILKKKLEIHFFEYSTDQNIYLGKNEVGDEIFIDLPEDDILIIGTKLKLYWNISGAYRIDLLPIGENIKGNSAHIIINDKITHFTLVAYGFFGKKVETHLEIPLDKLYLLDTTHISSYSDKIIRNAPLVNSSLITKKSILTKNLSQIDTNKLNDWHRVRLPKVCHIDFQIDSLISVNDKKKLLHNSLEQSRLLKSYTFSTKKYQTIITNNS
jgi:hypothetical protein